MHTRRTRRALALGLVLLAAPPAAAHASAGPWTYEVTAKVQMTERWSASSQTDIGLPGEPCLVVHAASGTTTTSLRSRRPTRVLVQRTGALPALDVGTGEGIPLVGASVVQGSDVTTHEGGGDCASANPPQAAPTQGCGERPVRAALELAFRDRRHVAASASDLPDREDCPTGPSTSLEWDGGTPPSLDAALADASPARFDGTRQLTLRGKRTTVGTGADGAAATVTWQWEATYRRTRR